MVPKGTQILCFSVGMSLRH